MELITDRSIAIWISGLFVIAITAIAAFWPKHEKDEEKFANLKKEKL
jgi:hypothetical protein